MTLIEKIRTLLFLTIGCASVVILPACTVVDTVKPINSAKVAGPDVCIIENPKVREGYLPQMQQALLAQGYKFRVLREDANTSDCPVICTYTARWSWDFTIYLAYSRITVISNGELVGEALYDNREGGLRLNKWIDAEEKIREQVIQLFPARSASTAGQ